MEKKIVTSLIAILFLAIIALVFSLNNRASAPVLAPDEAEEDLEPEDQNIKLITARIDQGASALGVNVVPLEIIEDSRCPLDAVCIQAGTVRIKAWLVSGLGEANQVFELGQPITTEAEIVTLVEVYPEPVSGEAIQPGEYSFVFEIAKRP